MDEPPDNMEFMLGQAEEAFPGLPALAARLGVPKHDINNAPAAIVLRMLNGDCYSVFAIVNAILDKIDKWEEKYGMGIDIHAKHGTSDDPSSVPE